MLLDIFENFIIIRSAFILYERSNSKLAAHIHSFMFTQFLFSLHQTSTTNLANVRSEVPTEPYRFHFSRFLDFLHLICRNLLYPDAIQFFSATQKTVEISSSN